MLSKDHIILSLEILTWIEPQSQISTQMRTSCQNLSVIFSFYVLSLKFDIKKKIPINIEPEIIAHNIDPVMAIFK